MLDRIDALIRAETARVERSPECGLLGERARARFSDALRAVAETVTQSTVTQLLVREVGEENPFAAIDPAMLTDAQREKAEKAVNERLLSGALALPKPLTDVVAQRLAYVTDAFIEMLRRLAACREALCELLPGGQPFTRIEDLGLSAGDTHNRGRSVAVLRTDAGRLVYKPRDMRVEAAVYALVEKLFSDVLGVPECLAFGTDFGVSAFVERERVSGREEARLFWRRMGGAAAVLKTLGSTDMHVENLICSRGRPYILDLETIVSPELSNEEFWRLRPELRRLNATSPFLSGLLPYRYAGREYSVLMNVGEDGCAPAVDGRPEPVSRYMEDFLAGYAELYRRILTHREEVAGFVTALPDDVPARILVRNTQFYHDTLIRSYRHTALADETARQNALARLEKRLGRGVRGALAPTARSELWQLERGDVPYFYACAGGHDLRDEGGVVAENVFSRSAKKHVLDNLDAMDERDLDFDLQLLGRSVEQYPRLLPEEERMAPVHPARADEALRREEALAEAEKLFGQLFDLSLEAPDGKLFWGFYADPDHSLRFCDTGLANGLTGIAVFAAAYARVSGAARARESADRVVRETVTELERLYGYYEETGVPRDRRLNLGETTGIGGTLIGLALLRRYAPGGGLPALQEKALRVLSRCDLAAYGAPDRMSGMAGLLSALCRFDEYKAHIDLISTAAESLLAMKTLPHGDGLLWRSFPDKKRPISGAGHGLAGVAEALYAAARVLDEERYACAAEDAIRFEREAYSGKFGTWGDLRSFPPVSYVHGYCSGAPGIGIMLERIGAAGFRSDALRECAALAARSVDAIPLNPRDHLCCGNSAVAEYYMTVGRFDEAGRVLAAMRNRSLREGGYRYTPYECHNGVTASLFYGASGVGYELLRCACPEKILSVL